MKTEEELSDLLHTASRAVGPDVRTDPQALISNVRRRRHRRQRLFGLGVGAAVALVAVAALPALTDGDEGPITVAAGTAQPQADDEPLLAEPPATLAPEPPTTTIAPDTAAPPPTTAPTATTAPPATSAPPVTRAPATVPGSPKPSTAATTTTTKPPGSAPELLSASGNAGGQRVMLRFSRPVVPGDGPNFDRPSTTPTTQDTYMAAMQLVVHQTDSTCSNPQGNAHEYLAGVGTDTLMVDATSLVLGTTYISISPGFAKSAEDGVAMKWVRCIAITVKG